MVAFGDHWHRVRFAAQKRQSQRQAKWQFGIGLCPSDLARAISIATEIARAKDGDGFRAGAKR